MTAEFLPAGKAPRFTFTEGLLSPGFAGQITYASQKGNLTGKPR
jgi:hypothetical protein